MKVNGYRKTINRIYYNTRVMQVTTVLQVVVSRFLGVWTAEEVTPVVSLALMEGVSPYRYSKCANLRIPRMVLKWKFAKIEPCENKAIHSISRPVHQSPQ